MGVVNVTDPDEPLLQAHADLAVAQERLMIALMREFAARAEVYRGIADNRTDAIEFGRDRLLVEARDVDEAYDDARRARQAWLDLVERRITREERQVLVLHEPQWWLDRPRNRLAEQAEPTAREARDAMLKEKIMEVWKGEAGREVYGSYSA
jgi:hypothetical protein